jgi:hypothetical protein
MKFTVSFADFQAKVEANALKAIKQTDKIFVVKLPLRGSGKVELNLSSGTFTVGSGSKWLAEITAAVESAGFVVLKRSKGWTVVAVDLQPDTGSKEIVDQFLRLASVVEKACLSHTTVKPVKVTKAARVKKTVKALTRIFTPAELAAIKAKNLETLRRVSEGRPGIKVERKVNDEPMSDIDPQLNSEEIYAILSSEGVLPMQQAD